MGMYTKLVLDAELNIKGGDDAFDVLQYMLRYSDKVPDPLPDHPLFETRRWNWMLNGASYYFNPPKSNSELYYDDGSEKWYISVSCSIKNYDSEIEHFLDWITPYLDEYIGRFIGYYMYEEANHPTLIYYSSYGRETWRNSDPQYHILR